MPAFRNHIKNRHLAQFGLVICTRFVQPRCTLLRFDAGRIVPFRADLRLALCAPLRYQDDMQKTSIDGLAANLLDTLPKELGSLRADAEANFRAALAGGLRKMDLVTREDFDVQRAVLERTRARLEALEERLRELEAGAGEGDTER